MRKTDKKREQLIVDTLNAVCEEALGSQLAGFRWLTHLVDYQRYPQSLQVLCIVDGDHPDSEHWLRERVTQALRAQGIAISAAQCQCLSEATYRRRYHSH